MNLRNAHVVITGGSKGVGAAAAHEFVKRGARVTLIARPSAELHNTADAVGAVAIEADLSDLGVVDGLIARTEEVNGSVDVLINNAALGATQHYATLTAETILTVLNTNLLCPMLLTHQVLGGMLERNRGAILNVTSIAGEIAAPHLAAYGSSKAGLSHFSQQLQRDVWNSDINVTAFVLGAVPGTQIYNEGIKDSVVKKVASQMGAVSKLTPEIIATKMADKIAEGYRGTVPMPMSSAPLAHWRRVPNLLGDRIFLKANKNAPIVPTHPASAK